jgi:hypothetical protein
MALIPFRAPTNVGVFGCTQAGKSTFIYKLLKQSKDLFSTPPKWILYCYGVLPGNSQDLIEQIEGLTMHEGLPSNDLIDEMTVNKQHGIVVLDDLISAVVKSPIGESLFIMGSHHKNMTVILVSQNIFYQGKVARTISLNMHYLVLFRNLRDKRQIKCLAQQIYPGQVSEFMLAYNDVHKTAFNYLIIDLHPHSEEEYRLRTRIFNEELPVIYKLDP